MDNKKVRMATSECPAEQGHTIVGGRPAGNRTLGDNIPRGLEALIKKAAQNESIKNDLMCKRDKIASDLAIELDESEISMLACVSEEHLRKMIENTHITD